MRIIVGVDGGDGPDYVADLVEHGADEFFAGYIPPEWYERYGWEVSLNRRQYGPHCQFTRLEDLAAVVEAVHRHGKRIFITFNSHQYPASQLPIVRQAMAAVDGLGVDAFVVADPALLLAMKEWEFKRPVHLSTGVAAYNRETIRLLCGLQRVEQVVLPRKTCVHEMAGLIDGLSDLDIAFEVMILGYRCHFNDEFCFTWHCGIKDNFCTRFGRGIGSIRNRFPDDWKETFQAVIDAPMDQFHPDSALDRLRKQVVYDRSEERLEDPVIAAKEAAGLSWGMVDRLLGNCGLCAIPTLRRIGVSVLKLALRGEYWQKLYHVKIVRTVADHPDPTPEFCRELVDSDAFCSTPGSCYYDLTDL